MRYLLVKRRGSLDEKRIGFWKKLIAEGEFIKSILHYYIIHYSSYYCIPYSYHTGHLILNRPFVTCD